MLVRWCGGGFIFREVSTRKCVLKYHLCGKVQQSDLLLIAEAIVIIQVLTADSV